MAIGLRNCGRFFQVKVGYNKYTHFPTLGYLLMVEFKHACETLICVRGVAVEKNFKSGTSSCSFISLVQCSDSFWMLLI